MTHMKKSEDNFQKQVLLSLSQGLKAGIQAWHQTLFPTDPSLKDVFIYESSVCIHACMAGEGIRSHYKWW